MRYKKIGWTGILAFAASHSIAQTLSVRTQLVSLDVSVIDSSGHPVLDLKEHDFSVLEDGKPQHIVKVELPSSHQTPASVEVHSTADLNKLGHAPVTILVLDEMNGLFEENAYARYSLKRFLEESPEVLPQATALLLENDSSFQMLCDFTRDRNVLAEIIAHHIPDLPFRRMHGGGNSAMERVNYNINSMEQIAEAYASYPGRKNIIWVGNALPGVGTVDMPAEDVAAINTAVKRCLNILLAAHTVVTTIDPTAETSSEVDLAAEAEAAGPGVSEIADFSTVDPLADGGNFGTIAELSGGSSIHGHNAIDKAIAGVLQAGTNYYTIFYKPDTISDVAKEYRRISVQIDRAGLTLQSRSGYYATTSVDTSPMAESMASADTRTLLSLDLSSAATNGMTYTAIPIRASLEGASVRVELEPTHAGATDTDELVVLVATLDAKKHIVTHHVYRVPASPADTGPKTIHLPFAADPRSRTARIVARNMRTGAMGSAEFALTH